MGKKIGSIDPKWKKKLKNKKWRRKHPLTYIDSQGHARAVPVARKKGGKVKKGRIAKRKHVKLGGTVVSKDLLKQRKQLKKIFYVTKAGSIMMTKSGLGKKRRRKKARKAASKSRKMTKKSRRARAGKRAWKTRVRKYGKSGCKRGRRKTKPRRCRRKPGRKTAARRRRRRRRRRR